MISLENSGLPLYLDERNNVMALSALLDLEKYSRKPASKMLGLLADETGIDPDEPFYDVYRGIAYPKDQEILKEAKIRYDITIVMPGTVNGEVKKTSGHYHGWNEGKTNTYGEVYEVLKGTALYVLQKSPNFDAEDPSQVKIEDIILVTVREGQTLIVPPGYGHASLNIGDGPMIFSNLAYLPCPVLYDAVKHFHGMSVYVKKDGGKVAIEENIRYGAFPRIRFATVHDAPDLGITFGKPAYTSFIKEPEKFRFLPDPDTYEDRILSTLDFHDGLTV